MNHRRMAIALVALAVITAACGDDSQASGDAATDTSAVDMGTQDTLEVDAPAVDSAADSAPSDGSPPDANPPDTATADAGLLREAQAVRMLCFDGDLVPDQEATLTMRFGAEAPACVGDTCVVTMPESAHLTLELSPGRGPCEPVTEVACALPTLSAGSWQVDIVGSHSVEVEVGVSGIEDREVCFSLGPLPDDAYECSGPAVPPNFTGFCYPQQAPADTWFSFAVSDLRSSCYARPAGCKIERDATTFQVTPLLRECECASCTSCSPEDVNLLCFTCEFPPLTIGEYRVNGGMRMEVIDGPASGVVCAGGGSCPQP